MKNKSRIHRFAVMVKTTGTRQSVEIGLWLLLQERKGTEFYICEKAPSPTKEKVQWGKWTLI